MKLGRYEIVRELGKGAMGIVYLAKDPLIGRLVALKTIRAVSHSDDDEAGEFQQRFVREAQAAGILNHPSIVTVHDIGQDEATGVSFIAMEYVEGQNLKEVLAQGRALSFDQIGDIISQVGDALDFAHTKGIVHRDVKPANIILLEGNRAKITDFGIAKIATGGANLTTTGQFLGTPNYMAPEQIRGAPVDGRTDLFSLGIVFYECLTRRKPFGGDSLTSISYKIVHEPFPPMHDINPQIPEGYEEVIGLCLQKDPARRYQRGKDLANAVRAVIRGERPAKPETLSEETMVTRDRDKIPTIEIPFPEADAEPAADPLMTQATRATSSGSPAVAAATGPTAAAPPIAKPRAATALQRTLSNVKSAPIWKRHIPAALFFGIIIVLAAGLLGVVASIRSKAVKVPTVKEEDVSRQAAAARARERKLRLEGNQFVHQGRVDDAYDKYQELLKIAPHSPAITILVQKLTAIRQQEMTSKKQISDAQDMFDQGMLLYKQRKYADAIPLFEQSFHLNPNSEETADYLKLAQLEQQRVEEDRAKRAAARNALTQPRVVQSTGARSQTDTARDRPAAGDSRSATGTAQLLTFFNSPVNDGYIQVKADGAVIVHENLWEETVHWYGHRKNPRVVNMSKEVPAKSNMEIEIWVVIPSMSVQEHHTMRQSFTAGTQHKLQVMFDQQTKKFDYQVF
ncbi:MAG TPA: serine/threonine-protein kinase [Thermoanaerobaculia bacterium]|nr:serine/threonine-protein kinase [Thermoanaerobaculia bacterium]